jgi:maltooligosyltrehalose synthase
VVVVVPRLSTGLIRAGRLPTGTRAWPATLLHLPDRAPAAWTDLFSGTRVDADGGGLRVSDALAALPVAVLVPGRG